MKTVFAVSFVLLSLFSFQLSAQTNRTDTSANKKGTRKLYIDVHRLAPGVKYEAVAGAHAKDLATEKKYNTDFQKFWVDEAKGMVYCLVAAPDTQSIRKTHAEAHGLLPEHIYPVTGGMEAKIKGNKNLYLDMHFLGAGKVNAADVAAAHQKDLAIQKKYGANFVNYWVNEKEGVVMCLVEAKDSTALIETHREAHGLLPTTIMKVRQGE